MATQPGTNMSSPEMPLRARKAELAALALLASPLVAGNLAWTAMAATDLILLGWLGPDALAAGALAINLYNFCLIAGMGLASGLQPLVAVTRGRAASGDYAPILVQAILAVTSLALVSLVGLSRGTGILILFGEDLQSAIGAGVLLSSLKWALPFFLLSLVMRNFISALERPFWGIVVLFAAIPINFVAGWAFIFGKLGAPRLGLIGAGLGTATSAAFMALTMIIVLIAHPEFRAYRLLAGLYLKRLGHLRALLELGLPVALTLAFEVGIFNVAALLAGLIDRETLAAHAIAIQIASLSFMVPAGISQAATIRVAYHFGRNDRAHARRAGWIALAIGFGYAAVAGLVLLLFARPIAGLFLDLARPSNIRTVGLCVTFLHVAAAFQVVDGCQVIGAGVLRGMQDTRVPMIFAFIGYWIVGLGVGVGLAFGLHFGGLGLWLGLTAGLSAVAILMVARWTMRTRAR